MEHFPSSAPESGFDDDDDDDVESAPEKKDSVAKGGKETKKPLFFDHDKEKARKDTAGKSESQVPYEKPELAGSEQIAAGREIIKAETSELNDELPAAPEGSSAEAELLVNAALLERIDQKLDGGEVPSDRMLDQSVAEVADELGIEVPDDQTEASQPEDSGQLAAETGTGEVLDDDEATVPVTTPIVPGLPLKIPPIIPPGLPIIPGGLPIIPGNKPVIPPPVPPVPPVVPPVYPPRTRSRSFIPPIVPPGGPGPGPGMPPYSPNSNPNVPPVIIERRSAALPYLVVGYLLGRRRGRIKTEKRLLPVQQKLEKQVAELHQSIVSREEKIRSLVRNQVAAQPAAAAGIVGRLEKQRPPRGERSQSSAEASQQVYNSDNSDTPNAERSNRSVSSAEQVDATHSRSEKIGQLLVISEEAKGHSATRAKEAYTEAERTFVPEAPIKLKVPERPKLVDVMTQSELVGIAERITVEQSTVKKLYETNRLTDEGLRRVVRAFLRGEHYQKVMRENLVTPNKSFEMDPHSASNGSVVNQPAVASQTGGVSARLRTASTADDGHTSISNSSQTDRTDAQTAQNEKRQQIMVSAVVIVAILALIFFLLR